MKRYELFRSIKIPSGYPKNTLAEQPLVKTRKTVKLTKSNGAMKKGGYIVSGGSDDSRCVVLEIDLSV
jgi:hypothetical protein